MNTKDISYGFKTILKHEVARTPQFLQPLDQVLSQEDVELSDITDVLKHLEKTLSWPMGLEAVLALKMLCDAYDYGVSEGRSQYRAGLTDFYDLKKDAIEELEQWCKDNPEDDPRDRALYEIADSAVPIYNRDRMSVMMLDLDLACTESELDGDRDCVTIAGEVIYDAIKEALYERWWEIEQERRDRDDDEEEDDEDEE